MFSSVSAIPLRCNKIGGDWVILPLSYSHLKCPVYWRGEEERQKYMRSSK
jgi:hypothetical protein